MLWSTGREKEECPCRGGCMANQFQVYAKCEEIKYNDVTEVFLILSSYKVSTMSTLHYLSLVILTVHIASLCKVSRYYWTRDHSLWFKVERVWRVMFWISQHSWDIMAEFSYLVYAIKVCDLESNSKYATICKTGKANGHCQCFNNTLVQSHVTIQVMF